MKLLLRKEETMLEGVCVCLWGGGGRSALNMEDTPFDNVSLK